MAKNFSNKYWLLLFVSLTAAGAVILFVRLIAEQGRVSDMIGCEKAVSVALASESDKPSSEVIKLLGDVPSTNVWVILPPEKYDAIVRLLVQQKHELDPPDRSLPKTVLLDPWGRRFEILVKRLPDQSGFEFRVRTSGNQPLE